METMHRDVIYGDGVSNNSREAPISFFIAIEECISEDMKIIFSIYQNISLTTELDVFRGIVGAKKQEQLSREVENHK